MSKKVMGSTPMQMKSARVGVGLSQVQLAAAAHRHPNTVHKWETIDGSGFEHRPNGSMASIKAALEQYGIQWDSDGCPIIPPQPKVPKASPARQTRKPKVERQKVVEYEFRSVMGKRSA